MAGESLAWFDAPSPPSEDEVCAVENVIGRPLPDDYRDLAKRFSGGSPEETDFEFPDGNGAVFYASVGTFLTLLHGDERNLLRWMARTEFFPSGLVPIAVDGGGNYTCLDYRAPSEPSIAFWHSGRRGMQDEITFVAKTFSAFVELLHKPDDDAALS